MRRLVLGALKRTTTGSTEDTESITHPGRARPKAIAIEHR